MKVKELKKLLNGLPPEMDNAEVIHQSDPEGNAYHKVRCADPDCVWVEERGYSAGEVYSLHYSAKEAGMEPNEWEEFKKKHPRCVVIAPWD